MDALWQKIASEASEKGASDIHIAAGAGVFLRSAGKLFAIEAERPSDEWIERLLDSWLSESGKSRLAKEREVDFSFESLGRRFRANAFYQRGSLALALRLIPERIPTLEELGSPEIFSELLSERHGLVLVSGRTGSGKTTTLSAFLAELGRRRTEHIITLEDPVEYVHESGRSLITQREYGRDFFSFADALRSALREDPDIIMVGEMRDADTVSTVLGAAETGHLVLSSLHTNTAEEAVTRIESFFPAERHGQIRSELAAALRAVISQQLLPAADGGRVLAAEVLTASPAVRNLIRSGKPQQLPSCILSGGALLMQTMRRSIESLLAKKRITREVARLYFGMTP